MRRKQTSTPRGVTPAVLLGVLRDSDSVAEALDRVGATYALIARWRKNNVLFKEQYDQIVPRRPTQEDFDESWPGWKNIFLQLLEEQLPATPKFSTAIANMEARYYIPLTTARLASVRNPKSAAYDEDFTIEVESVGAHVAYEMREKLEERLLEDIPEGKNLGVGLGYLKANVHSGLADRSQVTVDSTQRKIREERLEVRAQISVESATVGQQIEGRIKDVPEIGSDAAEVRSLLPDLGAVSGSRVGRDQVSGEGSGEEAGEQEDDQEVEVGV